MNELILSKLEVEKVEVAELVLSGVQTLGDALGTISDNVSYVNFNADATGSRVITMPAAIKGRSFRAFWSVEQATSDRVFTRAGSDTFEGNIFTTVEGNAAGDGDVVAIANTIVAITVVDDVNIGSYIDFFCMADGRWSVVGHLVLSAVGVVPTLA